MIDILLSLLAIVVVGFLVLCGGFYLFMRRWSRLEDQRAQQQRDAAERIRLNRVMSASRPSWRATEANSFNRKDGL